MPRFNVLFAAPFDLRLRDGTSIRIYNLAKAASRICKKVFVLAPYIGNDFITINNLEWIRTKPLKTRYQYLCAYADVVPSPIRNKLVRIYWA
jgi:hypothetical protein